MAMTLSGSQSLIPVYVLCDGYETSPQTTHTQWTDGQGLLDTPCHTDYGLQAAHKHAADDDTVTTGVP